MLTYLCTKGLTYKIFIVYLKLRVTFVTKGESETRVKKSFLLLKIRIILCISDHPETMHWWELWVL